MVSLDSTNNSLYGLCQVLYLLIKKWSGDAISGLAILRSSALAGTPL